MVTPISLNGAGCATALAAAVAHVTTKPIAMRLVQSFMRHPLLVASFSIEWVEYRRKSFGGRLVAMVITGWVALILPASAGAQQKHARFKSRTEFGARFVPK